MPLENQQNYWVLTLIGETIRKCAFVQHVMQDYRLTKSEWQGHLFDSCKFQRLEVCDFKLTGCKFLNVTMDDVTFDRTFFDSNTVSGDLNHTTIKNSKWSKSELEVRLRNVEMQGLTADNCKFIAGGNGVIKDSVFQKCEIIGDSPGLILSIAGSAISESIITRGARADNFNVRIKDCAVNKSLLFGVSIDSVSEFQFLRMAEAQSVGGVIFVVEHSARGKTVALERSSIHVASMKMILIRVGRISFSIEEILSEVRDLLPALSIEDNKAHWLRYLSNLKKISSLGAGA